MPETDDGCALVTGASRGIGAACARALAADGWRVAVNYRSDEAGANAVVQDITAAGGSAVALRGDVSQPQAAEELFGSLEQSHGPVLVLINNAGVTADGLIATLSDEQWEQVLGTNLAAAFRLTRRAIGPMLRRRFGRIVNVASISGLRAVPGQANYAASKGGLIALTRTVAAEVARRGVTVNAVAPGLIATDMTAELDQGLTQLIPARRVGTPEEVAACVRFLCSADASYVTGAVIPVDGGMSA